MPIDHQQQPNLRDYQAITRDLGRLVINVRLQGGGIRRRNPLAQVPKWKPEPIVVSLTGIGASSGVGTVSAGVTTGAGPNATVEQRVAILERNLTEAVRDFENFRSEQRDVERRLSERIEQEHGDRSQQVSELRSRVEVALASDLNLEWAGVILFAVGIFLGGVSTEIAGWL